MKNTVAFVWFSIISAVLVACTITINPDVSLNPWGNDASPGASNDSATIDDASLDSGSDAAVDAGEDASDASSDASSDAGINTSFVGATLTTTASYEWRDGAKLRFFKGKYWLLGGWTNGPRASWNGEDTTNEIWTSNDLVLWNLEVPHLSFPPTTGPNARWLRRHCFASEVFNDYLWVIGMDHIASAPIGDVWRSADGIHWEQVLAEGPWGRKRMPMVTIYQGYIHVLGGELETGSNFSEGSTSQHYRSNDGVHWEQLPNMPFIRSSAGIAVLGGKLIILGGNSGGTAPNIGRVRHNDVWSWDGVTWVQETEHAPWATSMWVDAASYDNKVWFLAGRAGDNGPADDVGGAWWSADFGKTWVKTDAPWGPSHADGVEVTQRDGIVMASGNLIDKKTFQFKVAQ